MRLELMPIHPNVVRFPLERRVAPSLSLVRQIAPDPREVAVVAEVFGLPPVTTVAAGGRCGDGGAPPSADAADRA